MYGKNQKGNDWKYRFTFRFTYSIAIRDTAGIATAEWPAKSTRIPALGAIVEEVAGLQHYPGPMYSARTVDMSI